MKKNKYILLTLLFIFTTLAITTNAHFGSKGPFGGSVSTMLTVDSTVYIGTFTGSVYQSSNSRLVTWTPRPVGIKSGSITALAHTGKYLFAATADSGIFYFNSIPKEKYWVKKNIGLGSLKVTSLIAIDSITLFAGTNGGGIFKTTNKGDNWTAVNNATLHHLNITALAKIGTRVIHTAEDGGIYASDDFGASWFDFNNINTNDISGTNILSVNAVLNEVLVLNKNGLFKGSLTTLPSVTPPDYNFADMGLPQGIKISSISNDGTNWYLSTNMGIFTSSTTAISWVNINMGLPTLDATFILPFQNKLVSSVRNEGIFTANKDFTIWTVSNAGFNNIVTYSLATSGELVVVAATEKGIFVSKDLAASYVSANKGLTDSLHVNDITFADFRLLAATKKAGIFISIDTGKTWSPMNDGIFGLDIKKIIYLNSVYYAIGKEGNVYSYSLRGNAWSLISQSIPAGTNPTSLIFYNGKLLLGTSNNGIFIKEQFGNEWKTANTGLTNLKVTTVTASASKIYAGTSGSGVFVSDTNSISWVNASNTTIEHTVTLGLNGKNIEAMASNGSYVFASYQGGVLATSDNGASWIAGGNQFNLPSYSHINKISFVKTRIFVTTENNSLYSNALSELPVVNGLFDGNHANSDLMTLSPNPNSGKFSISSDIPLSEISIYDFSGRLLAFYNSIPETLNLNYNKGIYFVKAKSGNGYLTKKIVIE